MPDLPITPPAFIIFPAIDLRGGKVVRLTQGDPSRQTTYGDDPLVWAKRWQEEGAAWLHVINLDGAFGEDAQLNLLALERILSTGLQVEFGGGLRDQDSIQRALDLGVRRVFLGTAAIRQPDLLDWALAEYGPEKVAGDIGAKDGKVVIQGWQEATPLTVSQVGERFRQQGLEWCVLTDVSRDGAGKGIDLAGAQTLQATTGLKVVASGGVSRVEEVRQAREAGLAGIIIGRALYEGQILLKDCWMEA